jgi:hypothetical protein
MKWLLVALMALVMVLHQDLWFWKDRTLVFGFVPIGLAYHVGYSLAASFAMWALVRGVWPAELERAETERPAAGEGGA